MAHDIAEVDAEIRAVLTELSEGTTPLGLSWKVVGVPEIAIFSMESRAQFSQLALAGVLRKGQRSELHLQRCLAHFAGLLSRVF
jgi:hypothetical protein